MVITFMFYPSTYGYIRVAAATPELRVAGVNFNIQEINKLIEKAKQFHCSMIAFPELALTSYSCADLFYSSTLLTESTKALELLIQTSKKNKITVLVGAPLAHKGKIYNCAFFIADGEIKGIVPKTYIVNVNEYYEERWFSSSSDCIDTYVEVNGKLVPFGADLLFKAVNLPEAIVGIEICEDLWTVKPPSADMALAGANILFNLSASDEYLGKKEYRRDLVKNQSARCFCAYIYSSAGPWESSTDLVFSGHSLIAENNTILKESERFKFNSELIFADIDVENLQNQRRRNNSFGFAKASKTFREISFELHEEEVDELQRFVSHSPFIPLKESDRKSACDEIFNLQMTGLARRLLHINSHKLCIGLSGGLDSTLALIVAVKTFEKIGFSKNGIHAITMPGFGTSGRTYNNAVNLAKILGVTLIEIPIADAIEQHFKDIKHDSSSKDIVYENAQARERTQILMDYANKINGIVLGTGDLSESALGWSTYNGDHMSMYNVNSSIPKSLIRYLIDWAAENEFGGEALHVLKDIADTPVSPELLPLDTEGSIVQKTESIIGPYILHDFFLYHFIRNNFSLKKIKFLAVEVFKGQFSEEEISKWLKLFINRFFANQYKRSCVPDGVKVGSVSLSPRGDWRMASDVVSGTWIENI